VPSLATTDRAVVSWDAEIGAREEALRTWRRARAAARLACPADAPRRAYQPTP
jgi:hypothetical protein